MDSRNARNTCIRWEPNRSALRAAVVGIAILLFSLAMIGTKDREVLSIFIRDILMILAAGFAIPLAVIAKEDGFPEYGLHGRKWYIYLPINLALGVLLLGLFLWEAPPPAGFVPGVEVIGQIAYIMLAGIFETLVFYSYIRTAVERSFGIIPGILAAAAFYSLHHAGFQPEFVKLFIVGIMYAVVFRLGNSALLIFPFFWGVGGCYDVLVQSEVVSEIRHAGVRAVVLACGMAIATVAILVRRRRPVL